MAGKKRKAESELSQNPNTVKVRKRNEKLNPNVKAWEAAKRTMKQTIARAIKKLRLKEDFATRPAAEQEILIKAETERIEAE
jgi:hypothetical protein